VRGLSWTADKKKAEWFAGRFPTLNDKGFVASGWVRKDDVLAHFIGRQESEIVVLPDKVQDVAITGFRAD
jgi:hypothetical protein